MSDRQSDRRTKALLTASLSLVAFGLLAVATYVFNVVSVLDQADQALAFWLLPFLLFGLAASGVGAVLFALWLLLVHVDRNGDEAGRDEELH